MDVDWHQPVRSGAKRVTALPLSELLEKAGELHSQVELECVPAGRARVKHVRALDEGYIRNVKGQSRGR